jgi:ThiF family/Prokaryotic E2 family A
VTGSVGQQLSAGQQQALASLREIARLSRGALTIDLDQGQPAGGVLDVRVWLSAASLPSHERGVALLEWEPIDIAIPRDFPFKSPIAATARPGGFSGLPHITRGSAFCLYASDNAWDPSAGVAGFIRQLISTYRHIALGTLAGHLQAWHPPPADPEAGCVVIRADLPAADRAASHPLLRLAAAVPVNAGRLDIITWLLLHGNTTVATDTAAAELTAELGRIRASNPGAFLVPALILPEPVAFEYSYCLGDLLLRWAVETQVIALVDYLSRHPSIQQPRASQETPAEHGPPLLLLRAPADTQFRATDPEAHFAAAKLINADNDRSADQSGISDAATAVKRLLDAPLSWAQVYDARPDSLRRRDSGRPTAKLAGSRVVILGCGALGAPIAEHCVRSGAEQVHLIDRAMVSPGILVRQPFTDADIGKPKAEVLAARLGQIQPGTKVTATVTDVLTLDLVGGIASDGCDLIIDATANRSVAARIERTRRDSQTPWPTLISVGISQDATVGAATVTPPAAVGAGIDLLRRLQLESSRDPGLADVHDAFFTVDRQPFHPEPGCSDSTFAGSITDVSVLAAQLLDGALTGTSPTWLCDSTPGSDQPAPKALCVARLGRDDQGRPARATFEFPPDRVIDTQASGYQVRIDKRALDHMRDIMGAALREGEQAGDSSPAIHTGGLLLGQFDEACQMVWVSEATGPPPGSTTNALGLVLRPDATRDYLRERGRATSGALAHVGFWHVHHDGSMMPSPTDRQTMGEVTSYAQRMLLLIVGARDPGDCPPAPAWEPEMYAELWPQHNTTMG